MIRLPTIAALLLLPGIARGQAGFTVHVAGGQDVQLALPHPERPPSRAALADRLWATVDRDLRQSGYFTLIDPSASLDPGGVEPGTFSFESWRKLKASVLVKTRVPTDCGKPNTVCADAWVYYVVNGQTLSANRYRTEGTGEAAIRAVGHAISNAILRDVTGEAGPFGGRIAAVGRKGSNKEIFLLDTDGGSITPVTRNGSINLSPAVSPGGRYLAWTSYKKGNPDLYLKDLHTGRVRVLSNMDGINASPAFSPDGKLVAMARSSGGNSDIYLLDARTGEVVRRLTKNPGIDVSPDFSPDGKKIVYASEASGGSQIFITDAVSGTTERLTMDGTFNTDPVFSPDGTRVAFVGRDGGRFDIFVINTDRTGLTRITQNMGDNEDPSWSPDGRYLVFSSTRTGSSQIWISTADGRVQQPVTTRGSWSQPVFIR